MAVILELVTSLTMATMHSSASSSNTPSYRHSFTLASPPELSRPEDRFSYPTPEAVYYDKMSIAAATHPNAPLSPPESPATSYARLDKGDTPLIPQEGASISLDTPLFDITEQFEPLITKAITSTESRRKVPAQAKPTADEYETFVSSAWRLCQSNRAAWLRQEKAYSARFSSKVAKPARAKRAATPPPRKTQRAPKIRAVVDASYSSPTPFEARQKAPAASREDSDFQSLVDLTPPLSTLRNDSRALPVEWKGTPLPIAHEPYYDLLHPAEQKLASTLRLTPAIYLSSKRRIFIEKVERTRQGKEFRKTDSQKACKIDVNKASRLWAVFDRAGWFDRKFIEKHL